MPPAIDRSVGEHGDTAGNQCGLDESVIESVDIEPLDM
jgi:hypothetical protein